MKTINVLSRLWYDNEESELSFPDRWRVNRPKGGQISHKDGCRNVPPERSAVPHPTFCGQDFLDIQDRNFYSSTLNKQCLIKKISKFGT